MSATEDNGNAETRQGRYRRWVKRFGLVLLFVLYIVVPIPIRVAGGSPAEGLDVGFLLLFGWIGLLFWIGACLLWWRIVDVQAKWIAPNKTIRSALILLPVVLIGGRAVYRSWPSVRAERVLYNADLAPLPPSAREIKVYIWAGGFNGEWRLRFRADRADIEQFLEASPALKGAECREYSKERMRLIDPDRHRDRSDDDPNGPDYFRPDFNMPPWYIQEIKGPGKRYETAPSGFSDPGEVIVHTEENLVFVGLSHG